MAFKLFEIDEKIEALLAEAVDRETGEIGEDALAALDQLEEEREHKALAVAAYLKGELCEAEAVKREAEKLASRAKLHERRAARLVDYLAAHVPEGQGYRDARSEIVWRKSTAVDVLDAAQLPAEYMRRPPAPPPAPDKKKLADALKRNAEVPGARLERRMKLSVR